MTFSAKITHLGDVLLPLKRVGCLRCAIRPEEEGAGQLVSIRVGSASNIQEQAGGDDVRVIKASIDGGPAQPMSSTPLPLTIGRAYERFLELPVAVVVGLMWLAGAALIGSFALAVYVVVSALL